MVITQEVVLHAWGDLAQLELLRGHGDGHNCWDLVYRTERVFGLFRWMAEQRNPRGACLVLSVEEQAQVPEQGPQRGSGGGEQPNDSALARPRAERSGARGDTVGPRAQNLDLRGFYSGIIFVSQGKFQALGGISRKV